MPASPRIVIVDYGLGNLYSVKHACEQVGLSASVTSSGDEIQSADALILPGVGAFGDAMTTLHRLDLVAVLKAFAKSGRPMVGICLGMQLMLERSSEFGDQAGLGLIPGTVEKIDAPHEGDRALKVPQIGWNGVYRFPEGAARDPWEGTFLDGMMDGEPMYFVHSYVVRPSDPSVVLATSTYGGVRFCSALRRANVMACQFHPERSGREGLKIYATLARMLNPGAAAGASR